MSLNGRTVAVVGLERSEMPDLTEALDEAGARWRAFGDPEATAVKRAHLIIARASAAARFAATKVPLLVIGTLDEVAPLTSERSLSRDFSMASPLNADEVILRATH